MTALEFRAALRQLDMTQRDFAGLSGVAVQTVNRWAKGWLPVPRWAEWVLELHGLPQR